MNKLRRRAEYRLQISKALQRKLDRCRAAVRAAIRSQLHIIAVAAAGLAQAKPMRTDGPAFRFYVSGTYRVSYRLNVLTQNVVVLAMGHVLPYPSRP